MELLKPGCFRNLSLGDCAALIDNPVLKELEKDINKLKTEKGQVESLLNQPADTFRKTLQRENLYDYNDRCESEFSHQKDIGMMLAVGTGLTGGAVIAISAVAGFIPMAVASSISSLPVMGGLGLPFLYLRAAKKWVLPKKYQAVEKEARDMIAQKRDRLEQNIERLDEKKKALVKKLADSEAAKETRLEVNLDDDFIIIDDIKIPRKPPEEEKLTLLHEEKKK